MADVIDVLLICWCVLALGVFVIGQLFEKHLKQQQSSTKSVSGAAATTNLDDFWPAPPTRHHNYDQQADGHEFSYGGLNSTDYQQHRRQHYEPATSYGHQSTMETSRRTSGLLASSPKPSASASEEHRQQQLQAIPTATGFNSEAVEWVNSILYLFYTQPEKYGPVIAENVYRSLNEKLSNITSSSREHANLMLEFEGLNNELSSGPELTNLRTECESDKSISASCKIYNKRLTFTLLIRRLLGGDQVAASSMLTTPAADLDQEARYELTLENLEGKLKSMAMLGDKLIVIQFIEKPDTKILLRPLDSYAQHQQLISQDVLVQMVLQTLTQVVVDLYFGADPDFPQYKSAHQQQQQSKYSNYKHKINNILRGSASELKRSLKGDLFHNEDARERRVFVKIIRAKNINYNQNVTCLMELDVPKQQAVSSTKPGNSNPFWDEHFLFSLGEKSQELRLELWDSLNASALGELQRGVGGANATALANASPASTLNRWRAPAPRWSGAELSAAGAKFLGLARVSLAELRANPVQRLSLTLQPAPGAPLNDLSNSVGGELHLELLLLEHSAGSPLASQAELSKSTNELAYQQGDLVSIDRKLTPSGFVITTTTITKQQQQQQQPLVDKHDTLLVRPQSAAGSSSMATTERSFDEMLHLEDGHSLDGMESNSRQTDGRSEGRLSRSRSRSRSFLRAIKKRFSFSRTRSRSIGALDRRSSCLATDGVVPPRSSGSDEQMEFEMGGARSRASSEISAGLPEARARSVPTQRNTDTTGELPTIVINKGARLSDGAASAFTFTHPKSQLVIEVFEPTLSADGTSNKKRHGIYRHYALSEATAQKRKWRKRGTKLHLFNEHQFIACHLASSSTCHLCGRVFSRRPGKQGYKCRNCHLLLHKQCHVKVDHNCPYAAREALQLEYIDAEPPASLVDELSLGSQQPAPSPPSRAQQQRQLAMSARAVDPYGRPRAPGLRSAPKSISMEVDDR